MNRPGRSKITVAALAALLAGGLGPIAASAGSGTDREQARYEPRAERPRTILSRFDSSAPPLVNARYGYAVRGSGGFPGQLFRALDEHARRQRRRRQTHRHKRHRR